MFMTREFKQVIEDQKIIGLMEIEELEPKIAPDGGETVLPLKSSRIRVLTEW